MQKRRSNHCRRTFCQQVVRHSQNGELRRGLRCDPPPRQSGALRAARVLRPGWLGSCYSIWLLNLTNRSGCTALMVSLDYARYTRTLATSSQCDCASRLQADSRAAAPPAAWCRRSCPPCSATARRALCETHRWRAGFHRPTPLRPGSAAGSP